MMNLPYPFDKASALMPDTQGTISNLRPLDLNRKP